MKRRLSRWLGLATFPLVVRAAFALEGMHHELKVELDPSTHHLSVEDAVTLPDRLPAEGNRSVYFLLHAGLSPRSLTPRVDLTVGTETPRIELFGPGAGADELPGAVHAELFRVSLPPGVRTFTLAYGGEVYHPLSEQENYARGFQQTPGTVSEEGVYLSGSSLWYPWLGGDLTTFSLEARLPAGWDAVSQGARSRHERDAGSAQVRWESGAPQDEIYLLAGEYTVYSRPREPVEIHVFLRAPDDSLAGKYLDVGAQYLQMYADLLGPYPYPKFALVENFWETGYGMPSFSLLGPRVIRFPFILHSSYPHEILHNWWGNGVYVDWNRGNWCEGLTAYLSDHLIQEGRGTGAEYRQTTLQKYADYVSKGRDFALGEFRSRHSSATEAVGYGKALMLYHMLRLHVGDEAFVEGLRQFYRQNRFKAVSFDAVQRALESISGQDLSPEFEQWVQRAGAPQLQLARAEARRRGDDWLLDMRIAQMQPGPFYRLRVPVAVTLTGTERAHQSVLVMGDRNLDATLRLPAEPLRIDVDPEFDVFRRLDPAEIPPALSGSFGADRVLVILPADADAELLREYRELAGSWARTQPGEWEVRLDAQVDALPEERAVWLFGWENRFRGEVAGAVRPYDAEIGAEEVRLGKAQVPREGHSVAIVTRHPLSADLTLTWLAADAPAPLPGLGRKLPHYHKYSYLGFEGDEPANVTKGRWPVVNSPLTGFLANSGGIEERVERAQLAPRDPLAELPPVFSETRMMDTVHRLASPEFEGRGFGTLGLDRAADSVADAFLAAGLQPGGTDGSYFQTWRARGGDPERETVLRNVIGILPGSRPDWESESVVVGAHYDHLGWGWPEGRVEDRGKMHPGADDNASGVAVLVELARVLSAGWHPERTLVFVAFSGEEAGRLGSRHYVEAEMRHPARKAIGMVNLDTIGRLGGGKLLVLGTETAREWIHIFRGAGFVTGVPIEPVAKDVGGSDQVSFIEVGVPAIQLFTGPHLDYHRPTDTADKVDAPGLVKVASVVKEVVEYLAGRAELLTTEVGAGEMVPARSAGPAGRRVSLGTVPDFEYSGRGVRLEGVVPGSPAERAGLRQGDVIVGLGAEQVLDLADLSRVLKTLQPNDEVAVTYVRGDSERKALATVEER